EKNSNMKNISLFLENILSMCLKEAVTNVVKHSKATVCTIKIEQSETEICISISDNGIGIKEDQDLGKGSGLLGMKERLEFVNGTLDIYSDNGTTLEIKVPKIKLLEKVEQS